MVFFFFLGGFFFVALPFFPRGRLGRTQLLGAAADRRAPAYKDDDTTRTLDAHGLLSQQEQVMREQDKGLEILQQSIARQKHLGLAIGNEIDDQNGAVAAAGSAGPGSALDRGGASFFSPFFLS